MNPSRLFIERPVATTLLMIAILMVGVAAYKFLPLSALPEVDYPTIQVQTFYPGASPEVMTSSVTAPLERQFGQMPSLAQMMSQSSAGASVITLRFSLDLEPRHRRTGSSGGDQRRGQSVAGRPARAADLRQGQSRRRADPDPRRDLEDAQADGCRGHRRKPAGAETVAASRRRSGVDFRRSASGRPHPRQSAGARRLRAQSRRSAERPSPISTSIRRRAISTARRNPSPSTPTTRSAIPTTTSIRSSPIATARRCCLSDVATVELAAENSRLSAWMNATPALIVNIQRQPGANVIQVVDSIKELLPTLTASLPQAIAITPLTDRTTTIRASVDDVEFELTLAVGLVVLVIFLFLRNIPATIIPSLSVPLSLVGALAIMYQMNFSLDNLSLMALTVATGFVVDDAIVVIENISRYLEEGDLAEGSRAEGLAADRLHHHFAHRFADRGAHSAAVHGRRRRPPVPRIRDHAGGDDRHLRLRLADAGADAVREIAAAEPRRARRARATRRPAAASSRGCCASTPRCSTSC